MTQDREYTQFRDGMDIKRQNLVLGILTSLRIT